MSASEEVRFGRQFEVCVIATKTTASNAATKTQE